MNGKQFGALAGVAAVLLAIGAIWHFTQKPIDPIDPGPTPVGFDQFQADLSSRVLKLLGAKGVTAVVAAADYPIGTLLRSSGSVPANSNDCLPAPPPGALAAPHLFPSYTLASDTALEANLGGNSIQGLGDAGVNLHRSRTLQYSIADSEVQIMDDKSVDQVTGQGNCGKYISEHPGVRLVRGTVIGRITYTVKVDSPATVKAKLAQFGFTINDNPNTSTISVSDQQKQTIIQLLSEFDAIPASGSTTALPPPAQPQPTPDATPAPVPENHKTTIYSKHKQITPIVIPAPPPPPPLKPILVTRAPKLVPKAVDQEPGRTPAAFTGPHIYVQIDAQDNPASGSKIVAALRQEWPEANVESTVEKLPSSKMPATAQVRFFNLLDASAATRALAILRKTYPEAQMIRIGIPSPKGQLELWFPKVK